jgi:hypothetical protein
MISRLARALVLAGVLAPGLATAAVTWDFQGTVTGTSVPAPVNVGDAFFVNLTFNPAATFVGYRPSPDAYSYDPSSISMTFGTTAVGPFTETWNGIDVSGLLYVRDNSLFFGAPAQDALLFDLDQTDSGTTDSFLLRLRDPNLGLITNHALPSTPDAQWVQGSAPGDLHDFVICLAVSDAGDCTGGELDVNLTSVSVAAVPEPGSVALLAAGLGVLAGWARGRGRAS